MLEMTGISCVFKHNQGLFKINYKLLNFNMINLSFIEEYHFSDSNYVVE